MVGTELCVDSCASRLARFFVSMSLKPKHAFELRGQNIDQVAALSQDGKIGQNFQKILKHVLILSTEGSSRPAPLGDVARIVGPAIFNVQV